MSEYLETAILAAKAGAEVLLKWRDKFSVSEKGTRNLVTQADLESQQLIERILTEKYPGHGFLGEEENTDRNSNSEYCWIVDPLDGTTNYVHQLPSYCVSIALRFREEVIVGVVLDPLLNECFVAEKGRGATLNDNPIQVSQITNMENALVATSLSSNVQPDSNEIQQFLAIIFRAQAVRRLGSAALNLCYVAMGRLDAYWALAVNSWDVAAGSLILTESGGTIRHSENRPLDLDDAKIIAASNEVLWSGVFEVTTQPDS